MAFLQSAPTTSYYVVLLIGSTGVGGSDRGSRTVWEYALRREMNSNLCSGPSLNGEMTTNSRVSFVMLAPQPVTMARNLSKVATRGECLLVLSPWPGVFSS